MKRRGLVAAGHAETAAAAAAVLEFGGNCFDAMTAALAAACVVEPGLTSLAGGGFLLARPADAEPRVLDFFVQTPLVRRPKESLDFVAVEVDFGAEQQEFQMGLGTVAVPGVAAGLATIQRRFGSMPLGEVLQPAIALARDGVVMNPMQAFVLGILGPIYTTRNASPIYAPTGRLLAAGEKLHQPAMADTLAELGRDPDGFYRGDLAARIARAMADGSGQVTADDLAAYRVEERPALAIPFRGRTVLTTPPPSSGGVLLGFGLRLLDELADPAGDAAHAVHIARLLHLTGEARAAAASSTSDQLDTDRLLDPELLKTYRDRLAGRPVARTATTHVSVVDADGNAAAATVSNGQGCGHVVAGSGVMLNNMLGEDDLLPGGLHNWEEGCRMTSMMAPTVVAGEGETIALGSGGSKRIRSAILQVIVNLLVREMNEEAAVTAPRLHVEGDHLSIEGGHDPVAIAALRAGFPEHEVWPERNLFYGGVHVAAARDGVFAGAGDPRRDGAVRIVE